MIRDRSGVFQRLGTRITNIVSISRSVAAGYGRILLVAGVGLSEPLHGLNRDILHKRCISKKVDGRLLRAEVGLILGG